MTTGPSQGADGDRRSITVGIDIGTTSVKALAVAAGGEVVAQSRIPHRIIHASGDHMEHDARLAWRRGPRRALAALQQAVAGSDGSPVRLAGICVAGMVPSLTAVDRRGIPRTPGLLYGDRRGRAERSAGPEHGAMPDAEGFLVWTANEMPDAYGYWPAQAVATHALAGQAVIDTAVASTLGELHKAGRWNDDLLGRPRRGPGPAPPGGADRPVGRRAAPRPSGGGGGRRLLGRLG